MFTVQYSNSETDVSDLIKYIVKKAKNITKEIFYTKKLIIFFINMTQTFRETNLLKPSSLLHFWYIFID